MITLQIASLKQRENALKVCIDSLINQVDFIRVALTNYKSVPDWLINDKIEPIICDNSLMDGHRFTKCEENEGYLLFCDDDIEYPKDFVYTMKRHLDFKKRSIVSIMGANLLPLPMASYMKGQHEFFRAFEYHSKMYGVNLIGMCGAMTHSSYFSMTTKDVHVMNSDVNVSAYCIKNHIQCFVVPHFADWCKDLMQTLPPDATTVWNYNLPKDRDEKLTDFINKNFRINGHDDLCAG